MKRALIFFLMVFFAINLCFPIPNPKQGTGSMIGKTYIELDKDWKAMRSGKYYKVKVVMFSKKTKKKYETLANKDGIFYFLNLQPGEYVLAYSRYKYEAGNTIFTLGGYFGKEGITINVNPGKITAIQTIGVLKELLPVDESKDKVTSYETLQRMDQKIIREDNMLELKAFFKQIDKRDQWANIEWE